MKRLKPSNTTENQPRLLQKYGQLIGTTEMAKVLGYPTPNALRMAIYRKTLPIRMFDVPGRRGKFALTAEVEAWLATLGADGTPIVKQEKGGKG